MESNSKKGNTLLKSIITLIVTLLLGTTAWNGVQENVSSDNNYNSNTNQTINTENKNDSDVTTNTDNISSNTSENSSSNDNQATTQESNSNNSQNNDVGKTEDTSSEEERTFTFRSKKLLDSHYEKHGKEMGFASAKEYETAASKVVTNKEALHKVEAEDGDDVYYIESTNEFVVVSTDGYLRTYFYPTDGLDYFNRQ